MEGGATLVNFSLPSGENLSKWGPALPNLMRFSPLLGSSSTESTEVWRESVLEIFLLKTEQKINSFLFVPCVFCDHSTGQAGLNEWPGPGQVG